MSDETPSNNLDTPELNYEEVSSSGSVDKEPGDLYAVLQQRGSRYGEFKDNAAISQQLKYVMYSSTNYYSLPTDMKESLQMIAHKIARILEGDPFYIDSWKDLCGYSQLVVDRLYHTDGATDARIVQQHVINGTLIDIPSNI